MERKSRKIQVRFFTLLCLLTFSVSCSSSEDGEESTDNAGNDTTAPTVTTVTPEDGAVDVLVSRLRGKLGETPTNTRFIKTIHGIGYKFIGKSVK